MSEKDKKNNGTGIMFGAIILMVVIVAIIFIVFFVKGGNNNAISQAYSNNVETNTVNEVTDENNTNNVEYISLNDTLPTTNSVDMQINADDKIQFDESYLGEYSWKQGDNAMSFELTEENGEIKYRLLYYPNEVTHASEELWGDWSTSSNIVSVDNDNENAIATYSFNDISYNEDDSISIYIQAKDVINEQLEMYKIPDGKYTLEKAD